MNAVAWAIAAIALLCVLFRPRGINEAWWAAAGAIGIVLVRGISLPDAGAALGRGVDVYLFLIGMMALAEFAKLDGIFEWIAVRTIRAARGSRFRLFALVYGVGILTTAVLSNDATIVVLTPAVIDALKRFDASPVPYVVACALIANAASFLLPISNPSNLLVFAGAMPPLGAWLGSLVLPSIGAIAITFVLLAWRFHRDLRGEARDPDTSERRTPTRTGTAIVAGSAIVLVVVSSLGGPLGIATFACACVAWASLLVRDRGAARTVVREMTWSIIPLTAALFVIVSAVDASGGLAVTRSLFGFATHAGTPWGTLALGGATGLASNLVNNLPVGLNVGETIGALHPPAIFANAALIGVNLGPNASVTGSLATILWLSIVRRARIEMTAATFLFIGATITPVALIVAILLLH